MVAEKEIIIGQVYTEKELEELGLTRLDWKFVDLIVYRHNDELYAFEEHGDKLKAHLRTTSKFENINFLSNRRLYKSEVSRPLR